MVEGASDVFRTRSHDTVLGYACLLRVEAALRQLIIEELAKLAGQKWHKQRLPLDLTTKLVEGPKYEKAYKWIEFIPHHPICYLDFPDLQKIVARADNWNECFKQLFGSKEGFQTKYRDIELVRNKVAHSRLITASELAKIQDFEKEISTCVGISNYAQLLDRYLPVGDIPDQLRRMGSFFSTAATEVSLAKRIQVPDFFAATLESWWFDPEYLPLNAAELHSASQLLNFYVEMPREPRDGYKVEKWLTETGMVELLRRVSTQMFALASEA